MPTYADFGGWVISTIAGWFVVTADTFGVLHVTNTDDDTWLMPATPATKVQHEDHRNALDGKALQKTPVWL
jgi:hypothetical protein